MQVLLLLVFPALMAFAAASDLLTMTISNRLALLVVASFFVVAFAAGLAPAVIASHVAAALVVLAIAFFCFARGWIGGGDAKLAAATVLWFGFEHAMPFLLWASLLGGVLTVVIVKFRVNPLPALLAGREWAQRLHRVDAGVPYGIALAAAALMVYPQTVFMKALAV